MGAKLILIFEKPKKMTKIVGIDVGTNSLGITVRDTENTPEEQIIYSTVHQFKSGVGKDKTGEFSLAALRTEKKGPRHLNKVHRYRKWATLKLLIEHKCCPLTKEELSRWSHYDKAQGRRTYPTDIPHFNDWIKLDFNSDGKPDFISPYELRAWLATTSDIDFSLPQNRYKLGRAIYHIAQRRGFKSSKGETIAEEANQPEGNIDLKKSEIAHSSKLSEFMKDNFPTVGCALFELSKTQRIRASEYQAIRSQYKDEIRYIFQFQKALHKESDFLETLLSEKKSDGTIFYKCPLKSQKGTIGKCTFEANKARCPQSRPEYELFTAWSFINTIRFGNECATELTLEQKDRLFNEKFIRASDFEFKTIRKWIEKEYDIDLLYSKETSKRTVNYPDDTKVEACQVTSRLKDLLGNDWQQWQYQPQKKHTTGNSKSNLHSITYTWEDVWHICFSADDEEPLKQFANDAQLDTTLLTRLFNTISVGYASLSLKAIRNINRFLLKGMLYNDACLFAKLPDILGDKWNENLIDDIKDVLSRTRDDKTIIHIVNALISSYKAEEKPWAFHDPTYKLQPSDLDDVQSFCIAEIGDYTWNGMTTKEQEIVITRVANLYQQFFASKERTYFKVTSIEDRLKKYLAEHYSEIPSNKLNKIYHHSKIQFYRPAQEHRIIKGDAVLSLKLLGSPVLSSLRNPMALRVLHTLRNDINSLLINGTIDEEDTRIVVEVARELNDANMRWAINEYDKRRRDENTFFESLLKDYVVTDEAIAKVRMLTEQSPELLTHAELQEVRSYGDYMSNLMKRYKLWHEQKGFCIYTGEPITLTQVLSGNGVDIEHTLPLSQSFDDSLSNKTLCKSFFNRNIKCNQLPSQLDNYDKILRNIQPWVEKVNRLKDNIRFWRYRSKKAQDKDSKDRAIRQRHLWEMEYDYWYKKVNAFRMKEIKQGFRNNQLADTSTIAKYATLFLKSLFTSVDVEKGTVTAAFRNIMQVPQKKRDNNSHHAVDALVLTYIPKAAQREKLLKLYYERQELEKVGYNASHIIEKMEQEKRLCGLNVDINPSISFLRSTVISRYSSHEQILTPAKRRMRSAGKIVPRLDSNGKKIYETDKNGDLRLNKYGNKIPQARFISGGDSIRGKLFEDNFYGKIMIDGEEKTVIRRGGQFIKFVEKHIKDIIDKDIREAIQKLTDEKGFEQAKKDGFYIIGPSGKRTPIRHVRCQYTDKPVVPVKPHAYVSGKEYKRYAYAVNGEVVLYALYCDGKTRAHRCITLQEVAIANRQSKLKNIEELLPDTITKNAKILPLVFVLHRGDLVILKEADETLPSLSESEISNRLYRFCAMEEVKKGKLKMQHHLYSLSGGDKIKASSTYKVGDAQPLLIIAEGKQNFWVEHIDFKIEKGRIIPIK